MGHNGPWTDFHIFLVGYKTLKNHAAGDAERVCGFSPGAGPGTASILTLALAALALAQWLRSRR